MTTQSQKLKWLVATILAALAITATILIKPGMSPEQSNDLNLAKASENPPADLSNSDPEQVVIPEFLAPTSQTAPVDDIEKLISELTQKLIDDHSHEKTSLLFQISLGGLRDDLVRAYPEQGQIFFERILRGAFPELADAILALIDKKSVYDNWLVAAMLDLNEMSLLEQQGTLWEKRYDIFGKEDAEAIWEVERNAEEERRETVQAVLQGLNHSENLSMQDRVHLLKSAYEESYYGTVEDMVLDANGVLAQAIFSLEIVQEELAQLSPEARQSEIDDVRRLLGFEEAQIAWLAKRDQEREKRWQNGYAYMAARNALVEQYEGEALNTELDVLRKQYFERDANTIKKEEEQLAFFRYERPRVYGRN